MHPLLNVIIYPDRMDWGLYNEAVEGLKKLEGRPNTYRIKAEALYYKEMMRRAGADVTSDSELFLEERTWYLADVLREYDKVARWDEDMQDEVRALLMKMTKIIEKERLFYAMHRDIKLTDD